jgi:hypothetical protein
MTSLMLVADCILKKAAVMASRMLYILPIAVTSYGEGSSVLAECSHVRPAGAQLLAAPT